MTVIVNTGSVLRITVGLGITIPRPGIRLTSDSTIATGGTLSGGGDVTGAISLLNLGTIEGNDLARNFYDDPSLDIITGTFDNQGLVFAARSPVNIAQTVVNSNFSNGTLTGGSWRADFENLSIMSGLITTNNATIEIDDQSHIYDFNSIDNSIQSIENSMSVIGTAGTLILGQNSAGNLRENWSGSGSLLDNGTVILDNATLSQTGGITISSSGRLITGNFGGTITSPLQVDGSVSVGGLHVLSGISGAGTVHVHSGGMALPTFQTYTPTFELGNLPAEVPGALVIESPGQGGTATVAGNITGAGIIYMEGGQSAATPTVLELLRPLSSAFGIEFNAAPTFSELELDSPSTFKGELYGFNDNSTLVLRDIIGNSASLDLTSGGGPPGVSGGILSLTNSAGTVASFSVIAAEPKNASSGDYGTSYANAKFTAIPNVADNSTTITVSGSGIIVGCMRAGTRVTTPDSEVAVEQLAVGARVVTSFGGARSIIWIGHRTIDCRLHPMPSLVYPVRVAAHAFGQGRPRRDLFLSPDHAVFVDDVLIPIRCLVDGAAIAQVKVDSVTYFHLELAEHDVLLADGLAVESWLDTGDRATFANGGPIVTLFPEFSAKMWEMRGCAPLIMAGDIVNRVRRTLNTRAFTSKNPRIAAEN